jgi:iron-sulfur cluster assembly accessory protein
MIQIRPKAVKELQRLLSKQAERRLLVHLNVVPGGCFEWTYQLTLTETYNQEKETAYRFDEVTVVLPNTALAHLQDLAIDYAEDLMGGGFRFVNPQAQQTCGCGNSFSLVPASDAVRPSEDCTQLDRRLHSFND